VPTPPSRRDIEVLEQVQPADLIHYGLIPEFVGRMPVVSVLSDLDQVALVEILTQPKNALVRQYQRLFDFENVKLRFTEESLRKIAAQALERKVGARGLRMILEDLMLDLMYHLPSQRQTREFVVTEEMVTNHAIKFSSAFLEKAG
jgi:ATP-dependent Clp protease ATP-binding subunit ClpX